MTNVLALMVLAFSTNHTTREVTAQVSINHGFPDGGRIQIQATVPYLRQAQPPPLPTRPFRAASVVPPLAPGFTLPAPDEDLTCRMFRVVFPTETNCIYGLECSLDLQRWELCPPEIDGTGLPDEFFDVNEADRYYRVTTRPGVLPEDPSS